MTPEAAFSLPALAAAARRAEKGKRARPSAARFWLDEDLELTALRDELLSGRWEPRPTRLLELRDPKPRRITVPAFRDRVVHQALAAELAPRVERRLIRDTYACRLGAGTHAAFVRARAWARTFRWAAHLDVCSFFAEVDHAAVRAQWQVDGYPRWAVALCARVLERGESGPASRHFPGDDLFEPARRRVGLPLGSLMSQLWANRYLDPVDHLAKDRLRVRAYLRYMDDLLLFHDDRRELLRLARQVEEGCHALRLRLHPYDAIPTRDGVSFVGYRVLPDHARVRRTTVGRAERRLALKRDQVAAGTLDPDAFRDSLRSTFAHFAHTDDWRLRERFLRRLGLLYVPVTGP